MKNPTGKKLEKVVFGIFDQMVEGADKYVTKQGSTWLIFTESRKWVIEFTKDKTLWFNYNVFQNELDLIGKDCTEERDLIKNWFESRFLNKPKVKESHHVDVMKFFDKKMENTIENGVKDTYHFQTEIPNQVEDVIQEGVKDTRHVKLNRLVDRAIENGVKDTRSSANFVGPRVEETIQHGVKHTKIRHPKHRILVEDTIQNGVKHTRPHYASHGRSIENTIQNGVKEINKSGNMRVKYVEDIIQNGVKQTSHSEDEDLDDVEDTIENGVKHTIDIEFRNKFIIEDTIQNGVKHTDYGYDREESYIEDAIQNGVKHTEIGWAQYNGVEDTIENGVKETKTPGEDGDIVGVISFMQDNNTYNVPQLIDDVIENGVKETKENRLLRTVHVMNTIKNGVKHVEDGDWLDQDERVDDIIENGVKEVKEISNFSLTSEIFKVNAKQAIRDGVKELKVWKTNRCEEHGYFEFVDGIPTYTPMVQVQDVIEDGVKELKELPDKSGEFRGYGDYYHRQEDITKPHTEYVKEVIEDSYNHMGRVEGVIRNTDKDGI